MSFFQNPFNATFNGMLVLGDRQASLTFSIPANINSSTNMAAWNAPPFNLSSNKNLTINYAVQFDTVGVFRNYTAVTVDVTTTAANTAAVTADEVVSALNASTAFTAVFTAMVNVSSDGTRNVVIKSTHSPEHFRAYISNTSAETVIRFNKKAGVAELPTYFARHTIANANAYSDSNAQLVQLDPLGTPSDATIVSDAGLNASVVQADWQLFRGRSGIFNFQKMTVDTSNRITQIIEYPAGAQAGDFAREIRYQYSGTNTNPSQIAEIPYTLTSGDLITP